MATTPPTTVSLAVEGSIGRADLPALCERLRVLLEASDADLVLCDVGGLEVADAVVLDALARLQLTARRHGCRVRVRHASEELCALLAFTGLGALCGLRVESGGQPEEREERVGVEEERELDDPAA